MERITFTVNGTQCSVSESTPRDTSLNAYLRYTLALPGTKAMCREGGCGACAVTVRAYRLPVRRVETFTVNSCLVLVFQCHGWHITTVEGLGSRIHGYSDIQKRIAAFNGTQCGYCTPGWVMHLNSLKDKGMTMEELEKSFGSNTCRCTGFRPILDTIKSFAVDAGPQLCQRVRDMEDLDLKSCPKKEKCERKCSVISDDSDWSVIDDLKLEESKTVKLFGFASNNMYVKVYKKEDIFDTFRKFGTDSYMLLDGNTGKGITGSIEYPNILIDISGVESLKTYEIDQNLVLGANISLEDCIQIFKDTAKQMNDQFAYLDEFAKHLDWVAHMLVRKIGSLAGNLMIKHSNPAFPSDVFLLLSAVGAMITVEQSNSELKNLRMDAFLKFDMRGVLVTNVVLPPMNNMCIFRSYKIMPRNQNAIATVNAAFLLKMNRSSVIEKASIVYGNISQYFIHAKKTEAYLQSKKIFNNETLQGAIKILDKEVIPQYLPQTSPECRKKLAIGLFYKFILNISPATLPKANYRSGRTLIVRPVSSGKQDFETNPNVYPLTKPVQKYEAMIQSSGEAEYINDIPTMPNQVFAAFVLSTIHSGDIDNIDGSKALEMDGVLAIYTATDIPGKNSFTPIYPPMLLIQEEEILAKSKIKFYGQPVAVVAAESEKLAEIAAQKVEVTYKNVSNEQPILTIDQAKKISERYIIEKEGSIEPKGRGTNIQEVIKGVYSSPSQFAYFMEPMTSVAIPVDDGVEVHDSTHFVAVTQGAVAQCLGLKNSQVSVKVRRIGGGFGAKLTRSAQVASACSLVAKKMDRPCRFIVPLKTCMAFGGKRMPSQWEYEAGVNDDGKIQYVDATVILNKGSAMNDDYSGYFKFVQANCYKTDYFSLKTAIVLTDIHSNTYLRAPGVTEAIAFQENLMEHIAIAVQKDPINVRLANMEDSNNEIPEFIEELKRNSDYEKRSKDIEEFNQLNRWMKKGLKMSVMQYRLSYLVANYSALVSIYRDDGSVSITTGGVEIGQGLNTKVAQVCAFELGIPLEDVKILPHYSFVAANNYWTAGSFTSECVCYAVIKACDILRERLEPIKQKMPNATWKELVSAAAKEEVELAATYTMTHQKDKNLSGYSIFGAAAMEVQLDVLTGRYQILRVDILEDIGQSISPNIDVGQIEGAFIQGLGLYTTEKLLFNDKNGSLLTNRSLNYHVPLAMDIPIDFRIKLRKSQNPKGVLSSKASGEMGMCTANVITLALRQCILESRKDSGYDVNEWIHIDIPYDAESILKALCVKTEEMVLT